jgi:malate dehydrogenase (oxaloacetate-decarboxylating)
VNVSDRVFLLGGNIHQNKVALTTRGASMAHTLGVCASEAIAADRASRQLTIKGNSVAVVSDGTAVLGLGDIGPEAAMPVMEGKAMLFKEFAGIDAYPICLRTKEPDEIVAAVKHFSVGFGGINLEDISAPRCFEIERNLQEQLTIPVFHDDQHGTVVVVLAALLNDLRLTKKKLERLRIVICGAGAAGTAVTQILLRGGRGTSSCAIAKASHEGRLPNLNESKVWLAQHTNPRKLVGPVEDSPGTRTCLSACRVQDCAG